MKKQWAKALSVALAALFVAVPAAAQDEEARPSPKAQVMQTVGTSEITITYSSPGVKGRTVWGELVPYDEIWRAGANEKTMITFSDKVKVEGKELAAGSYGIYIIPKESGAWTVAFNKVSTGPGTEWDEAQDAARIEVTPVDYPQPMERLMFGFTDFTDQKPYTTDIFMLWADKLLTFGVEVVSGPTIPVEAAPVMELISQIMKAAQDQDIDAMTAAYADDFTSDQGGGKAEMVAFLQGAKDQGFLEDLSVSMDEVTIEMEGDKASVENIGIEGAFGVLTMGFELEKRDGKWVVTYQSQY